MNALANAAPFLSAEEVGELCALRRQRRERVAELNQARDDAMKEIQ